jgi:hypothetical protein
VWFIHDDDVDPYRSGADANSYGDIYTYGHSDCNRYCDIHAHTYSDASRQRAPLPNPGAYANSNSDFDPNAYASTDTGSSNGVRPNRCDYQ